MRGLKYIIGADHALQGVLELPSRHVDEMDDGIHPLARCRHQIVIGDVADEGIIQIGHFLSVESAHLMAILQALRKHRAYSSGRSSDHHFQVSILSFL